jgi:hypothetical protein
MSKFLIDKINFENNMGTCHLVMKKSVCKMVWSVVNYPVEPPSMPGAPYPVLVSYTIFSNTTCDNALNSQTGNFIYEINSGTLPNLSPLGIPYGFYKSVARHNKTLRPNESSKVIFNLTEQCLEVMIK